MKLLSLNLLLSYHLLRVLVFAHVEDDKIAYGTGQSQWPSVDSLNVQRRDALYSLLGNETRFLLYEVNPGEGFNLRRDVHIRAANLVKHWRNLGKDWVLVLPPWRHLYHWRSEGKQEGLPWRTFFDLNMMNKYVPTIEFEDLIHILGKPAIEHIVYLQRYDEPFKNGWEEKIEEVQCSNTVNGLYEKDQTGRYRGHFWGLADVYGTAMSCVAAQGHATILTEYVDKLHARSVFVDRFEEVLHVEYGGKEFWQARRSLVFARHLRQIADEFRKNVLNSTDEKDKTPNNSDDWRLQVPEDGSALGGPYLAVHLRRADFLYAHHDKVPTMKGARRQIKSILKEHKVKAIFIATDGGDDVIEELQSKLKKKIYRYRPTKEILEKYGDGGVAIIDQWIAAHGRYFIGTCLSTFSFRIHEERDILGFHPDTTFNCFCADHDIGKCEQPTRWRVGFA